jgi:hypothetical protein
VHVCASRQEISQERCSRKSYYNANPALCPRELEPRVRVRIDDVDQKELKDIYRSESTAHSTSPRGDRENSVADTKQ